MHVVASRLPPQAYGSPGSYSERSTRPRGVSDKEHEDQVEPWVGRKRFENKPKFRGTTASLRSSFYDSRLSWGNESLGHVAPSSDSSNWTEA